MAESTLESLQALRRGLLRAERFALFLAVCNSPALTRNLIRILQESMPGSEIQTIELDHEVSDPLAAVIDRLQPDKKGAVMIVGLEHSCPSSEREHPVLHALNLGRPEWPRRLPRPVVLWIPEYLLGFLEKEAPDFLDWRSDTLFFLEDLESRRAIYPEPPEIDEQSMTEQQRLSRLEELRARLIDQVAGEDPVALGGKSDWLLEAGEHLFSLGRLEEAEQAFRDSLEIEDRLGRHERAGVLLNRIAQIYEIQGRLMEAEDALRASIEKFQAVENVRALSTALHNLSAVQISLGKLDEAEKVLRGVLDIQEKLGDSAGTARSYHQLGIVAQDRGDYKEAEEAFRRSLELSESRGDLLGAAPSFAQLGRVAELRGDYKQAEQWYMLALEAFRKADMQPGVASVSSQLGSVFQSQGDYLRARTWHERALKIFESLGNRLGMAVMYYQLGRNFRQSGLNEEAQRFLLESARINQELGSKPGLAAATAELGFALAEQGSVEKALPLILQSLWLSAEIRSPRAVDLVEWLRRQRQALGEQKFRELLERHMEQDGVEVILTLLNQ